MNGAASIRSELVARIAAQNPHLYARDVERVVSAILDRMADADRRRLGRVRAFGAKEMQARTSRDPCFGQPGSEIKYATEYNIPSWLQDREDRRFTTAPWARRLFDTACYDGSGQKRFQPDGSQTGKLRTAA